MTLSELVNLKQSGKFHHATYRDVGSLWEGLRVYETSDCAIGYKPAGCFYKDSADLKAAQDYLRGTGVSFGSYR